MVACWVTDVAHPTWFSARVYSAICRWCGTFGRDRVSYAAGRGRPRSRRVRGKLPAGSPASRWLGPDAEGVFTGRRNELFEQLQADHVHTETPKIELYLQLFNGDALIEQPFGQAVMAGSGGHGQLWGQRDECIQVDGAAVGRRPQQRQVRLTRRQERKKSLDGRKGDRGNGGYLTPARRCWKGIHLSFSLRLLRGAVPLDGDQQIRLIDLLTQRSRELMKPGPPEVSNHLSAY